MVNDSTLNKNPWLDPFRFELTHRVRCRSSVQGIFPIAGHLPLTMTFDRRRCPFLPANDTQNPPGLADHRGICNPLLVMGDSESVKVSWLYAPKVVQVVLIHAESVESNPNRMIAVSAGEVVKWAGLTIFRGCSCACTTYMTRKDR